MPLARRTCRRCNSTLLRSRPTPSRPPADGSPRKKRRSRREAVPRAEPRRADNQGPRGGGRLGAAVAAGRDGRPARRCPEGRAAVGGVRPGHGGARLGRRGLRQRRGPPAGAGDGGEGVHPAERDPQGAKAVRPRTIPQPQHHGTVLPRGQGAPAGGDAVRRKKAANYGGFVWLAALVNELSECPKTLKRHSVGCRVLASRERPE